MSEMTKTLYQTRIWRQHSKKIAAAASAFALMDTAVIATTLAVVRPYEAAAAVASELTQDPQPVIELGGQPYCNTAFADLEHNRAYAIMTVEANADDPTVSPMVANNTAVFAFSAGECGYYQGLPDEATVDNIHCTQRSESLKPIRSYLESCVGDLVTLTLQT